jgi:hypothetical protein
MNYDGMYWTFTYNPYPGTTNINVAFNNGEYEWDNNDNRDWHYEILFCSDTVTYIPDNPVGCNLITIKYNPSSRPLEQSEQVYIHIGRNEWQDVIEPNPSMVKTDNIWTYEYTPLPGTTNINVVFNDGNDLWDNNDGNDWQQTIVDCTDSVMLDPYPLVACASFSIIYNPLSRPLEQSQQVYIHIGRNGWQDVIEPNPSMVDNEDVWTYEYTPLPGTTNISVVFNNGSGMWDNNDNRDWHFLVPLCE